MKKTLSAAALISFLTGCATTPSVEYHYYPYRAVGLITVTQTVDCTRDKSAVFVMNSVNVATQDKADYSQKPYTVTMHKAGGAFADIDFTFIFTDDGRLKSVNGSTTGQGETIFKDAVTLASSVASFVGGSASSGSARGALAACTTIANRGGDKPITIIYSRPIDFSADDESGPIALEPTADSAQLYADLREQLPLLQVLITPGQETVPAASANDPINKDSTDVVLQIQSLRDTEIKVLASGGSIWIGNVLVPTKKSYAVPIPKAALFGSQTFQLVLNDNGAITTMQYANKSGGPALGNVLASVGTAAQPDTDAEKVAATKARADLIVQQQRLVRCRTKPEQCQ